VHQLFFHRVREFPSALVACFVCAVRVENDKYLKVKTMFVFEVSLVLVCVEALWRDETR
jgi:hypothetical protein